MNVTKIVSGGQTGVDRAALDAAVEMSLEYGGWCPLGGWAEDLPNPPGLLAHYPRLRETRDSRPALRTRWNIRDSDATMILFASQGIGCSAGTVFTQEQAQHYCKPAIALEVGDYSSLDLARVWLATLIPNTVLNVAGPRESEAPGIYEASRYFIKDLLKAA
ncbi:MAG: putative molybdenum carrier protein [Hyphomicrobiaceae bacterium]